MATISKLQKKANSAPKFVLQNGDLFISDKRFTSENLTSNLEYALKFSVGYDDERMKSRAWSMSLGFKFDVKYL